MVLEVINSVTETSYLMGDRSFQFWIEGLIMILLVNTIVKLWLSEKLPDTGDFWANALQWIKHNAKDYFLGILVALIAMRALEWGIDLFQKQSGVSLPHTDDDFLWFIPFSGFIAFKIHKKFHKHIEQE